MVPGPLRARLFASAALTCAGLVTLAAQSPPSTPAKPARATPPPPPAVVATCSKCHHLPTADILPKTVWATTLDRMMRIRSKREVAPGQPVPPIVLDADIQQALEYFVANAPDTLPVPPRWPAPTSKLAFDVIKLAPPGAPPAPAVANVEILDVVGDARPEVVVCDMRHGLVMLWKPYDPAAGMALLAYVANPDHATLVDLDRDGHRDLLISDLGDFFPWDHGKGGFTWLRGQADGSFQKFAIGGLPRVADVQPADFDGDGDLDLVVAAFGYREQGGIMLLENRTTNWAQPQFAARTIDARAGSIHVPPVDLDGDGRMDFVAVLSQQHERVVAFMNVGNLGFRPEQIFDAPHPNWGSSGIELTDLDGDGDVDVLYAHGDTMDDSLLKPHHGVEWLENLGELEFEAHAVARIPGVHRARAIDLDGDGDLDIVASSFLPDGGGAEPSRLASIAWLEHVKKGVFEPRTLELGLPRHACLALGDVNGDGKADIVVGNMAPAGPVEAWVEVWKRR
jgi:hypothetical protein